LNIPEKNKKITQILRNLYKREERNNTGLNPKYFQKPEV